MSTKKIIFLIFAILLGAAACYGLFLSIPMIMYGYQPHEPDELNGLAAFFGFIILIPTLMAIVLTTVFTVAFKKSK